MADKCLLFNEIVKESKELFLNNIETITEDNGAKACHRTHPDFPMFFSADDGYYRQCWYIRSLECHIREDLIKRTIKCAINKLCDGEYEVELFDTKNYILFNNQAVEDYNVPIEFIISDGETRIGYRFTEPLTESIIPIMRDYKLNRIDVIICDDYSKAERIYDSTSRGYICVFKDFFIRYFTEEEYNYFLKTCREAVYEAREIIGYLSVQRLTNSNIFSFKNYVMENILKKVIYSDLQYHVIEDDNKGKYPDGWRLNRKDCEIIVKRYVDSKAFAALVGNSDFATCFVTAEYMFSVFNYQDHFDYTSIVAGYLKCIELILYKIVLISMGTKRGRDYFITANKIETKRSEELGNKGDLVRKNGYPWIRLIPEYKDDFKIEMGSLISFLDERNGNKGIWLIDSSKTIIKLLKKFNQECRNEHFHKDVISDYKTVEIIRENTLLLAAILIGGCELTGSRDCDLAEFGIDRQMDFERLYAQLLKLPKGAVNRFIFEFEDGVMIKAYRSFEQEHTRYDKINGSIKDSKMKFIKVDDFDVTSDEDANRNCTDDSVLLLSMNRIPQKVWYIKYGGEQVELVW